PELRQWAAAGPTPITVAFATALLHRLDTPPPRVTPADTPVPDRIGPYRVEAVLGRGGGVPAQRVAVVYKAVDDGLRRTVAVKVIRLDLLGPGVRERFVREGRAAARVRHDHIVSVYAVGKTADGAPYLAMEYLAGPTLAEVIRARG